MEYKWGLTEGGEIINGLCDFGQRTIYIRRELLKDEKPQVFLHELIHAALFECHLYDGGLDPKIEEIICEGIADVFTTLFTMRFKRG